MFTTKKAGLPDLSGNPAIFYRPVVFRPCLPAGLVFAEQLQTQINASFLHAPE